MYKVEQCGEFIYRYFRTHNKKYPTQGQPYFFLTTGLDNNKEPQPAWMRIFNGGQIPPMAGDILVAKGKDNQDFHTALITEVSAQGVSVLQANVPLDWQSQPILEDIFSLQYDAETLHYFMPNLPTSRYGYSNDFVVTGWIRGTTLNTKF